MSGYRGEVAVSAGPSRGSLVGRGGQLLVRVRLFDGPGCPEPLAAVYTDLWPEQARELAFGLLAAAEDAERDSRAAGFWRRERDRVGVCVTSDADAMMQREGDENEVDRATASGFGTVTGTCGGVVGAGRRSAASGGDGVAGGVDRPDDRGRTARTRGSGAGR